MQRRQFLRLTVNGMAFAGSAGLLAACGGGGADPAGSPPPPSPSTALAWNQTAVEAIRLSKPGPPMAARSLAVVHGAMYDAWAAYHDSALSPTPGTPARRPAAERSVANRIAAFSHAAYTALLDQFPGQQALFDSRMQALGLPRPGASGSADPNSVEGVGVAAARAMLTLCHADGANQLGTLTPSGLPYADYTGYVVQNPPMDVRQPTPLAGIPQPGHWQQLRYLDAAGKLQTPGYVAACWGQVRPFALASANQFRPGPPAAVGSDVYQAQASRIVAVQAALTEQQKVIAEYWADGPNSELPPGHWCLFAQYIAQRDGHDDDRDIRLFFVLANALFDAGIAAWDAKRAYDAERPITAVRYLMNGSAIQGYTADASGAVSLRTIDGAAWTPYQLPTFPTPPFPEHVSGHSSFSAAAAEVLARFTGSDQLGMTYTKTARSLKLEPALPTADLSLNWPTFTDAAQQAGISRIYGGIHFDKANEDGQALGRQVGAAVYAKAEKLWSGIMA